MKKLFIGLLFASTYALAGGWFTISIGQPSAHSDPKAHTAAFTIQVYGCAANATEVTATAEGLVDGKRVSVPLQLTYLSGGRNDIEFTPGRQAVSGWPSHAMAVSKSWPTTGTWLIRVVAGAGSLTHSALVAVGPDGVDRAATRTQARVSDADVDAALRRAATLALASRPLH